MDSDLEAAFFEPSQTLTDGDVKVALASLAFANAVDRTAMLNNRWEQSPPYRKKHVINLLMSNLRSDPKESYDEIYNRVIAGWNKQCDDLKAKGKVCSFAVSFEATDWNTHAADYSQPRTQAQVDQINKDYILTLYPEIVNTVKEVREKGAISLGSSTLRCDPKNETEDQTLDRVVDIYRQSVLKQYFVFTKIGIFAPRPIDPEILKNPWGPVSFKMTEPPANLAAFEDVLQNRLDAEYLKNLRTKFVWGLLYSKLGSMGDQPSPIMVHDYLQNQSITKRSADFAIISFDISKLKYDQIKDATDKIITAIASVKPQDSTGLTAKSQEVANQLKASGLADLLYEQRSLTNEYSPLVQVDIAGNDQALYGRLFRRETNGISSEDPTGTENTYYLDSRTGRLNFVILIKESAPTRTNLDPSDKRIDYPAATALVSQQMLRGKFFEMMESMLKDSVIILKDPINGLPAGAELAGTRESAKDLSQAVQSKLKTLEGTYTADKAFQMFLDHVFTSPLRPKWMLAPKVGNN